jgi:hypothetical protein
MVIESGEFSVNTARLTASWAGHIVADSEKRRLIFLFSESEGRFAAMVDLNPGEGNYSVEL